MTSRLASRTLGVTKLLRGQIFVRFGILYGPLGWWEAEFKDK